MNIKIYIKLSGKNQRNINFCARMSTESLKLFFYGNIGLSLLLWSTSLHGSLAEANNHFLLFTVYPAFEMRNPGPIIDCKNQPEGYITDYLISSMPATAGRQTNDNIFIKMDELPVTATVTFEIEKVSIAASTHHSLEIGVRSDPKLSFIRSVYRANSSTTGNETQTVTLTGDKAIIVSCLSKRPYLGEHMRLKYRGG